jgi:ParB family chromosome partitioning protein
MKDKKRAMGRGLGAILNAESKTNINTASDKVQKIGRKYCRSSFEDIYPIPISQELILMKKH